MGENSSFLCLRIAAAEIFSISADFCLLLTGLCLDPLSKPLKSKHLSHKYSLTEFVSVVLLLKAIPSWLDWLKTAYSFLAWRSSVWGPKIHAWTPLEKEIFVYSSKNDLQMKKDDPP